MKSFIKSGFALLLLLPALATAQATYVEQDGTKCGPSGTAKNVAGKDLNRHKNRFVAPSDNNIDPEASLAAMLAPGQDSNRFDEERGASFSGFVIDVKRGGKETCNCQATDPIDMDTHIELGLSPDAPENERVIVEVTPRLRQQKQDQGVDWSTDALRQQFKGRWVQVTGWLLFDSMHVKNAENTNPGNPKNWRATCWEIHPITDIQILNTPPDGLNDAAIHASAMTRAHAAHVKNNPKAREAIDARNNKHLSKFRDEDKEEAEEESREHGR